MENRKKLAEKHQKMFGTNLTGKVVKKEGRDHSPIITVEYDTQWGVFQKTGLPGENQKIVFEKLAIKILQQQVRSWA